MEESPPPVPPKDSSYHTEEHDMDNTVVAPPSGSKRKRNSDDHDPDHRNSRLEIIDVDAHTPKRGRSHLRQSDADVSDDAVSGNERNLRRKKKVNNLSNMNLRHAAQRHAQQQTRSSRFQEGSLTDKPSAQPPSVFTRMIRTDSGNIRQVDDLMADYHDGLETSLDPVEMTVEAEKAEIPSRVSIITADSVKKDDNAGGLFRFGRSWASSFRPVALWNKLWNETRDDLIRQNIAEAERKAQLKAEAEAKYAEMKAAGQFNTATHSHLSSEDARPRDSAVVLDSARTSLDHKRNVSSTPQLLPLPLPQEESASGSEVPDTDSKAKTMRSRFHFKRPSLSNLKNDLKRVKSDFNLAASANRESSSSLSPVKGDFSEESALKRTRSKLDLKKTHKLSKRVSDLEAKLSQARRELDVALVEASPMPKLGNKYERFTPQSTLRRPKFVPGKLQTLPSERLLNPEQLGTDDTPEPTPRRALDLTEAMEEDEVNDDTVKARNERPYPPRATSLFSTSNNNIEDQSFALDSSIDNNERAATESTQIDITEALDMDPNSVIDADADGKIEVTPAADYSSLDAKLKALDANMKLAKKSSKPKKRKSSGDNDDAPFKPRTTEDDDELTESKPKKKRKSTGGKKKKKGQQSAVVAKEDADELATNEKQGDETEMADAPADAEEGAPNEDAEVHGRTSMDSQGVPLEPVYEEEEETSIVQLKDAPSKPTARATPARYGRHRSNSPHKRAGSVQPGAEETMMVRAATAAQMHPGRQGRSASPGGMTTKKTTVQVEVEVGDGDGRAAGAAELTKAEALKMGMSEQAVEDFQWPDDVF